MTPRSCLSVQTSCADICWRAVSSACSAVSSSCTVATPSVTGTELTSSAVPSGKAVVTAAAQRRGRAAQQPGHHLGAQARQLRDAAPGPAPASPRTGEEVERDLTVGVVELGAGQQQPVVEVGDPPLARSTLASPELPGRRLADRGRRYSPSPAIAPTAGASRTNVDGIGGRLVDRELGLVVDLGSRPAVASPGWPPA